MSHFVTVFFRSSVHLLQIPQKGPFDEAIKAQEVSQEACHKHFSEAPFSQAKDQEAVVSIS